MVLMLLPPVLMYLQVDFGNAAYQPDYSLTWLEQIETGMRDQTAQQPIPAAASMTMLWQTPMAHLNVGAEEPPVDVAAFNARIAVAVLSEFYNLYHHNPTRLVKDGAQANDINQVFFEWQKRGGWSALMATPEIHQLEQFIQASVDKYLLAIGLDQELVAARSRQLQIWATVHDQCVRHLAHTHPDSIVSGVYYVKMPNDAGSIIFEDPRGPLPPFENKLTIQPKMGDLVLFPSWLVHQVAPTPGTDERISIAFNVPGEWSSTASVSEWFPLQARLNAIASVRP